MASSSHRPTSDVRYYLVEAGDVINPNDLTWFDGTYIKPVSVMPDQGTPALNQTYLASRFVGVCIGMTTGDEKSDTKIAVQHTGSYTFDVASTAFKPGDYVGGVEAVSGTELEDQKVAKVTDDKSVIGIARNINGTYTQIEFEINPMIRERIINA